MSKQNKSMYVVLGILSYGSMSGYDIKMWIEEGVGYFWKISYNQIYPTLKKFVEEGLATCSNDRREGRPERKVYSLSDKGREVLREWLREPIDHNNPNGNELLLKLFFSNQISSEESMKHIIEFKNKSLKHLEAMKEISKYIEEEEEEENSSRRYRLATVKYGMAINRAFVGWCDEAIRDISNEDKK